MVSVFHSSGAAVQTQANSPRSHRWGPKGAGFHPHLLLFVLICFSVMTSGIASDTKSSLYFEYVNISVSLSVNCSIHPSDKYFLLMCPLSFSVLAPIVRSLNLFFFYNLHSTFIRIFSLL